ncbi:MAG: LCP family protein [Acidimicrobiia bacterium]|nr:LCP family protein [Acidimicrobiia bacterium]
MTTDVRPLPTWQQHDGGAPPPQPRWRRRLLIGLVGFLVLAILATGLGYAYLRYRWGQITRVACPDCGGAGAGSPMTVLVVGSDSRANLSAADAAHFCAVPDCSDQAGPDHSDSIILIHADPAQRKATVLSIPRDLNVPIANSTKRDRINTAFSVNIDTLVQTINQNFGIKIDHFVVVDFVGFRSIVNSLGGIDVYFPSPARDLSSGLNVPQAGCAHLAGDNALGYVRSRHYQYFEAGRWHDDPYSDLSRIQRQQDFIRRVMRKSLSVRNPLTVNALIGNAVHAVKIDSKLSQSDILHLGQRLRSLSPDAVEMLTVPSSPITVGGADELKLQQPQAAQTIQEFLQPPTPPAAGTPPAVLPNSVRLRVLNGTGTKGQATAAATKLQEAGFGVAGSGDADNFAYSSSVVRYGPGQLAKARYVASLVGGGAQVQQDPTLKDVDLVVVTGSNFTGVTAPSAAVAPSTTVANGPQATPGGPPANKGAPAHPTC